MNDVKVIPTEECVQQHNLLICDFTVCIPSAKKHKFIPRICTFVLGSSGTLLCQKISRTPSRTK